MRGALEGAVKKKNYLGVDRVESSAINYTNKSQMFNIDLFLANQLTIGKSL